MRRSILELLVAAADSQPHDTAIRCGRTILTFGQLQSEADKLCAYFQKSELAPGTRVAFFSRNCAEFAVTLFACAKSGLVFLPLSFRLAEAELSFILADAAVGSTIASLELASKMDDALGSAGLQPIKIALGDMAQPGWTSWHTALSSDQLAQERFHNVAVQMYTSGTTGRPKGAQLSHAGFLHLTAHAPGTWGDWSSRDINLIAVPLSHIGGTVLLLIALAARATSILHADFIADEVLESVQEDRVTRAFLVPSMIKAVLEEPRAKETDFSSLRQIVYAASPIPKSLQQEAMEVFGCDLAQVYGMTETTGAVTYLGPDEHRGAAPRLGSCGKATDGTEIRILDEAGRPLPFGLTGEIAIRTRQIMLGYWNREIANKEAFRDDWFLSGDAGELDAEGYLYVHDRIKDMIISGGENIYPAEVEAALITHPDVLDVAIIGLPDPKWGEAVTAVVVAAASSSPQLEALRAHARNQIGSYKLPKRLELIDELPRNVAGKVLKHQLRHQFSREQRNCA